ncbi:MAG: ATP-binding protein [Actinobacteria bacterium]|nr:ATP-binding protein [Actinomycetota bacterium]
MRTLVTDGVSSLVAAAGGAIAAGAVAALLWLRMRRRLAGLAREVDAVGRELAAARSGHEATRARSAVLRRALDAIPQGVVIGDADGVVALRNGPASAFSTARHGEALVEAAIDELLAAAAKGSEGRRSVELFGPPRRVLDLVAIPLGRGGGVVVIDDVTERHRVDEVRRDFVANISHELKTPIGAIGLLAETMLDEPDAQVAHRLAARVVDEAFRVGRTIDDLLELSRIEARERPSREPVTVPMAVAEAVDRLRPAADLRGVHIHVREASPRLTVLGDRRQLVSALTNLLDNAVKYSDRGSAVEVRARTDGVRTEIDVEDHGIGIPARDLERIFERFYRVDRARSRDTGGTGLGLAIVRHVAQNLDGDVRVRSREGAGSTFTLVLPAGPGPVALPAAEAG